MTDAFAQAGTLVLWDIDGTLLGGREEVTTPYARAIARVVDGARVESIPTPGMTDAQGTVIHLKAAGLDTGLVPQVLEHMDILSYEYLTEEGKLDALPGVDEAFAAVNRAGATNALLTGNTPGRAMNKLRGAGINTDAITWTQSFFGTTAPERPVLTARARAQFPNRRIVVIGDTPRDGQAAAAAQMEFIGVQTGGCGEEELRAAGAFVVVENLVNGLEEIRNTLG